MTQVYGDSITIERNFVAGTDISSGTTYAAGDVVGSVMTLGAGIGAANSFSVGGGGRDQGHVFLQTLTLIDKTTQAVEFDVLFFDSSPTTPANNSAANFTDAQLASSCIGHCTIATTDYVTLSSGSVACIRNVGLQMQPATSGTIYAVAVTQGTPDYAGGGLTFKFAFSRDK